MPQATPQKPSESHPADNIARLFVLKSAHVTAHQVYRTTRAYILSAGELIGGERITTGAIEAMRRGG